jgi:transposase
MRRPIYVRELKPEEREALEKGLRSSSAFTVRRCQILLDSATGQGALEIAQHLHCDDQTVRNAIKDFDDRGLDALTPKSSRPHVIHAAFDERAAKRLKDVIHQSPRAYGQTTSVWTLDLVAEVAFAEGLTATRISGETVRVALKRLGVSWQRAKQWITSPDPAYARKKTPVTG